MQALIDRLNNQKTVEETHADFLEKGWYYGGIAYSDIDQVKGFTGNWWDGVEKGDPVDLLTFYSNDPLNKDKDIWELKNRDTGEWVPVCWCYEIIELTGYRYQYNESSQEYDTVSEVSAFNVHDIVRPIIAACDCLWKHKPAEECQLLVEAICSYVEKHKKYLKDESFDGANHYKHAGVIIDRWSQMTGIEVDNPTGHWVKRADWATSGMRKPRVTRPRPEDKREGKAPALPTIDHYDCLLEPGHDHAQCLRDLRDGGVNPDLIKEIAENKGIDL